MEKKFADELIELAVKKEEEAYQLYTDAANLVKKPEVKKLFSELAAQELKHKETLQAIDLTGLEQVEPIRLSDPNLSALTHTEPLSEDYSIQDALLYAIKREDESYRFYKEFAELAEDTALKNVFENLATMEMRHKTDLEEMYESKIYWEF